MSISAWWRVATAAGLCVTLAACLSSSPSSQFYALTQTVSDSEPTITGLEELSVGIGPFHFPTYLQRPHMVVRRDGNELVINEFARWGGEFERQYQDVVVRNVSRLASPRLVLSFPWRADFTPDLRIVGTVWRFEAETSGVVTLELTWAVQDLRSREIAGTRRDTYRGSADPGDPRSIALGLSGVAADFSRDAAAALADAARALEEPGAAGASPEARQATG